MVLYICLYPGKYDKILFTKILFLFALDNSVLKKKSLFL